MIMSSKLPVFFLLVLLSFSPSPCLSIPRILSLVPQTPLVLFDHKGTILSGNITVNLLWYGRFSNHQHVVISDFFSSLSPSKPSPHNTAASWWSITGGYRGGMRKIILGKQTIDKGYSRGKSLTNAMLESLAVHAGSSGNANAITFILTSSDVGVEDFCMNRCGAHGVVPAGRGKKLAYAWVGNSIRQCPGQCAWPFHKPVYGLQFPPLIPPNGDVGVEGMVINIATVLAGVVTNPFDGGYYQGNAEASLEAVSACTGIFGKGAFPGYPGNVLKDKATGASFNAVGAKGRKFMLPAMWDPKTKSCKPLV